MKKRIVVIGGGAAGFFAAVNLAEMAPGNEIVLLEKSQKLLAKVKISGGGRCNVTNHCFEISQLVKNYPRGEKELKTVFRRFGPEDTIAWFEKRGVKLHTEADGRMFPITNSSQTIINCLLREAERYNVRIQTGCEVKKIIPRGQGFELSTTHGRMECDFIIVTAGGFPKMGGYDFLSGSGHTIVPPVPSLFTINLPGGEEVTALMGLAVKNAEVKVAGSALRYSGPLLITHWGFSGPAVLKLSAFAARLFHERNYEANVLINWTGKNNEEEVRAELGRLAAEKANALPGNTPLFGLPERLRNYLLHRSEINPGKNWSEQNRKALNRLVNNLYADAYRMKGKTTFKEEFVTCGGINLKEVEMHSMESRIHKGLYFAGEVLNIDGITGGFNFQAAWSTAFVAAGALAVRLGP